MKAVVERLIAVDPACHEEVKLFADLGAEAAPVGLYFIVDASDDAIFEPALLFLHSKHGLSLSHEPNHLDDLDSFLSNRDAAYVLAEFLRFLDHVGIDWRNVDHDTMRFYTDYLMGVPSATTGRPLQPNSIMHKLNALRQFYAFTNDVRLTTVQWNNATLRARLNRRKSKRHEADDEISPLSDEEIAKIRKYLGPLPSERHKSDNRPCIKRLIFELGIDSGIRGEEVSFIPLHEVTKPHPASTTGLVAIMTAKTKGGHGTGRKVSISVRMLSELRCYAEGERKRAINAARGAVRHDYLFVNGPGTRFSGKQLKKDTIQSWFADMMCKLSLTRPVSRMRNGLRVTVTRNLHSFHDTRHTFAVRLYLKQKAEGDSEPWITVQRRLGHKDWVTTRTHYLRVVGDVEALIGMREEHWLRD